MMHLPHLRELHERFELVALCDVSAGTLRYVGDYYGVARRFADHRERSDRVAMAEFHEMLVATAPDPQLQRDRERIDDGDADAVQAARDLV